MKTTKNLYVLFGGNGFIGTNIYNQLLHADTYFLVIDRESKLRFIDEVPEILKEHVNSYHHHLDFTDSEGFKYLNKAITYFITSTITKEDLKDKFNWNLTFVHLASTVGVVNNISGNFGAEMRITQNIIYSIKHIVKEYNEWFEKINICYTSTSELFGENSHKFHSGLNLDQQEDLFDLTCLYSPKYSERSEYIYQKYIGERLFKNLNRYFDDSGIKVQVFILRLFNIVGPYQDTDKGVFSKFVVDIIRGKACVCSNSIRRYVPIEAISNFFNPYSKSLFGVGVNSLTSVMFTGHEKLFCGTGEELYIYIKEYLRRKYPNCRGISKTVYTLDEHKFKNGIDRPKEIFQRFEKRIITDDEFELYYGQVIESIIEMQIKKYGSLSKSTLGIEEQSETIQESAIDDFPGRVTHYKDGIALIEDLPDFNPGDLVLFENNEKGLMIDIKEKTCVILGKGDKIEVGLKCKLNGKLQIPDNWREKIDK